MLAEERSRGLTLDDLKLTKTSLAELRAQTAYGRMALFEVCEIVRLCEAAGSPERAAIERLRDKLLEVTKAEHNLLPHEETQDNPKIKSMVDKSKLSKLLPRYDLQ